MTEKRYQVFVSSTYEDLKEERRVIQQGILKFGGFPAGMELFAASNASQWELIKKVIDLSDYYIVVVAGRYGSIEPNSGVSYTEKEFDYALEREKPILGFVHQDPGDLPSRLTDSDEKTLEQLEKFRSKVLRGRTVSFYTTQESLEAAVISALYIESKENPMTGWVRGDQAMTLELKEEILSLREQLAKAREEKAQARSESAVDNSTLAQGSDSYTVHIRVRHRVSGEWTQDQFDFVTTWDQLFAEVGSLMSLDEATQDDARKRLAVMAYIRSEGNEGVPDTSKLVGPTLDLFTNQWEQILTQLKVLGLIEKGTKRRAVSDSNNYLKLTSQGELHLHRLQAVKSPSATPTSDRTETRPEPEPPPADLPPELGA